MGKGIFMKISLSNKKELLEALNRIQGVVEKKNTLQILSNIYLHVQNEILTLKATDLEVSVETSIPVRMLSEGKSTVSAKSLYEIVKELPDKEIQIQSKENHWIQIQCGKINFNILGLAPEDFPSLPGFSGRSGVKANKDVFKNMIDNTLYAVSTDESRYQLNGVFLESVDKHTFRMVAADGYRLAYFEDKLVEENKEFLSKGIIIPRKGIKEIRDMLNAESASTIEIAQEGNHLLVRGAHTFLSVRLIEGQFPDYRQVVPKNNSKSVELDRTEFLNSLVRVSLLANEKSKGVKFAISNGKIEISSNNPELGDASEVIETSYKGDALEVGFNANYVKDSLAQMKEETVLFELNDRVSPALLRSPKGNQSLSVVMPMRI